MPNLLLFVPKTHPILREAIPKEKNLQDPELKKIIEDMLYSIRPPQLAKANAAYESAAGMAANQWGIKRRVFIFSPEGSDSTEELEVMINPSYLPLLRHGEKAPKMISAYEACFSVPLATGLVNRYEAIMATYYTPEGKKVEKTLEGWPARVFQHETDHLDGKLYDGALDNFKGPECLERVTFKNKEEMDLYYRK